MSVRVCVSGVGKQAADMLSRKKYAALAPPYFLPPLLWQLILARHVWVYFFWLHPGDSGFSRLYNTYFASSLYSFVPRKIISTN